MRCLGICLFLLASFVARPGLAQPLVAETPALTPAEELKKFHLPPGFEIQLVAQEPDIHKPMNMKFDAHGRLWVTHSIEYPFPAISETKARDAISIFSNLAADGGAQKVERFAERLNIPIGVQPLSDKEAFAWSIPNIYRLVDTNGDGVADEKTVAFGPFGVIDTHGDQNAFMRWIDGWIYANHGYNNDSRVKVGGTGDSVLHMQSGNTYRFRPDGSTIEQFSWGQVNPFGLSFDPRGDLYSADCHSRAVTLLLREGYYQSFGKPHDGLGFAPETTTIDHGGTGIAGVVYCTLPNFPANYRNVLFVGNVITNRVHCDRLKWAGSTPTVDKVEDFLTCDDPWFRPVDLQPGPDGALYVADFYNCIIGHYEVPLTHPKRDRERGRIWRVVYKGEAGKPDTKPAAAPMPDLPSLDAPALFALLKHPNLTVRVLATNNLIDRFPKKAAAMSSDLLSGDLHTTANGTFSDDPISDQASHAVWILKRTQGLSEPIIRKLFAAGVPPLVQIHTARALGETATWQPWQFEVVRAKLSDPDPFVCRAAAEALSKHPAVENLSPLLTSLSTEDQKDELLYHGTRIALRDQLRDPEVANVLLTFKLPPEQRNQLVEFAANAPTGPASQLLFDEALHGGIRDDLLIKIIPAAARYIDAPRVDAMIAQINKRFPNNPTQQISLLRALAEGLSQRGLPTTGLLKASLTEQIKAELSSDSKEAWVDTPLPGSKASPSPWGPQNRKYNDGAKSPTMMSSLASGDEHEGGILRSPEFELPEKLSFWMCGHNGIPSEPDQKLNFARLVLADGTEVTRSYPPRNDVAQRFNWDLSAHAGQRGYVEVVDGATDLNGFAWIAVSRFDPAVISVPTHAVDELGSVAADLYRLAGQYRLLALTPEITAAAQPLNSNLVTRLAATESLAMLAPENAITPLTAVLSDASLPTPARKSRPATGPHRPARSPRHVARPAKIRARVGRRTDCSRPRRQPRIRRGALERDSRRPRVGRTPSRALGHRPPQGCRPLRPRSTNQRTHSQPFTHRQPHRQAHCPATSKLPGRQVRSRSRPRRLRQKRVRQMPPRRRSRQNNRTRPRRHRRSRPRSTPGRHARPQPQRQRRLSHDDDRNRRRPNPQRLRPPRRRPNARLQRRQRRTNPRPPGRSGRTQTINALPHAGQRHRRNARTRLRRSPGLLAKPQRQIATSCPPK